MVRLSASAASSSGLLVRPGRWLGACASSLSPTGRCGHGRCCPSPGFWSLWSPRGPHDWAGLGLGTLAIRATTAVCEPSACAGPAVRKSTKVPRRLRSPCSRLLDDDDACSFVRLFFSSNSFFFFGVAHSFPAGAREGEIGIEWGNKMEVGSALCKNLTTGRMESPESPDLSPGLSLFSCTFLQDRESCLHLHTEVPGYSAW